MAKEAEKKEGAAAAAADAAPSAMATWLPVIAVVVLVPVISFAMAEFVLFPRLVERLGGEPKPAAGAHGGEHEEAHAGGDGHAGPMLSHEFSNVVSNLSGSMKSRYIKVSFTAYSSHPNFEHIVQQNHAKILDTTLSVLGALTLAELEDPAIKNRMRADLVSAYEALLKGRVIEEIYFSEFVVQ